MVAAPFVAISVLQVDIAAWDSDDEGNVGMKREWKPWAKAIARKGFHFKRALFVSSRSAKNHVNDSTDGSSVLLSM